MITLAKSADVIRFVYLQSLAWLDVYLSWFSMKMYTNLQFHSTEQLKNLWGEKSNFLRLCSKLGRSKQFWTESLYKLEWDWRRNAHIKHADGKDSQNYLSLHFLFGICHCWFIWKRSHKISKGIPKRNKNITPCECNRFSTGVVVNFQQV